MDDEEILGLSFLAFRRTATMLHIPAISISGRPKQVFPVSSAELEKALDADGLSPEFSGRWPPVLKQQDRSAHWQKSFSAGRTV
jgi:hypothetical protein